ncbi:MAG: M14 family metallopeptidase, partial [Acidobacteriota bacterium]
MIKRFFLLLLLGTLPVLSASAQAPALQSPEQFLGYAIGARYTPDDRIVEYFHALEQASPLLKVVQYGETYEHRPLIYAIIASEANLARIEEIRGALVALSDPTTTSNARAGELAASIPAVSWLAFGVHGNETSSSEAAMMVAHHLLAGGEDVEGILKNTVVIIDPCQNPDGHDRFVNWYRQVRGETPDPNPDSMQQFQPWPGGRYNHYLIDMNRDWAISSQQETRARIAAFQQWYPQVFVDFHEMGYRSSYFFPPTAAPLNSNIGGDIMSWYQRFGKANAEAFSQRGWPFFVNEEYDFFYPGYGDTWPALHGAIGMTYEVAGQRGLAIRKPDGTVLTLADRAERHYTTALTTLKTTAENREGLLLRGYDMLADAMKNAKDVYLLVNDSPNQPGLVSALRRQNIDVSVLTAPARLRAAAIQGGQPQLRDLPAGTAVVSTKQRFSALVQTLLERTPSLSKGFVEEQRRKIDTDNTDDFYDITAWSLPIAENVTSYVAQLPLDMRTAPWPDPAQPATIKPARYGYLIDGLDPNLYQAAGA